MNGFAWRAAGVKVTDIKTRWSNNRYDYRDVAVRVPRFHHVMHGHGEEERVQKSNACAVSCASRTNKRQRQSRLLHN